MIITKGTKFEEMGMDREALNELKCEAPEVADESEHFYVCKACGQAVDMRRLGDVFHHEDKGHKPITSNAA